MVKTGVFMGKNISRFGRAAPEKKRKTPINLPRRFEHSIIRGL
jgi:hypothetical protein